MLILLPLMTYLSLSLLPPGRQAATGIAVAVLMLGGLRLVLGGAALPPVIWVALGGAMMAAAGVQALRHILHPRLAGPFYAATVVAVAAALIVPILALVPGGN